ncbi:glycosyltransferase, partial [Vibrio jasicida]|uniref:glycosyltransferase n=1 Tax=Vibrio jasicida TaxID=766224 RepID=UPI0011AFDE68
FKFEIIIHDDASTDKTPEIIDYFVSKFPSIVKFIKQDENQYSISRTLPTVNVLRAASGDFVALCEGDDYWIDQYKIDKQLRILSKSGKNICFTQAESINDQGQINKISCYGNDTRNVDFEDVILGGGSFMCTPTIMFNRNVILELIGDWFFRAPVGDYFLQVLASQEGAVYIPDITARYRLNSTGSWSSEQKKKSTESIEVESSNMDSAIRYIFPTINISSKIEEKVCSRNYL